MSESELAELKSVLRSLVVSSPTKVDVRSILKDYRSLIGSSLPHAKFGYRDPVQFFKERCGDCFLLQGSPTNPVLTLIVPDTLKHIDKFVQAQKATPNTKLKGKRTSIPEPFMRRQNNENLIVKTFNDKTGQRANHAATPAADTPINMDKLNITYRPKRESQNKPMTSSNKEESNNTSSNNVESPAGSSTALQMFLRKRLPQYNSQNMDSNKSSSNNNSTDDADSGRVTSSSSGAGGGGGGGGGGGLEALRREVHALVRAAPRGLWCMDLMRLYRERYKRELNFTRFGYMSIVSLVKSMPELVRVTRPRDNGDWRLTDAGAAPPAPPPAPPAAPARAPRPRPRPDPDDALPGIDFDPDVFPADCLHFVESIPPADLADVRPGAMIEVNVGEVYSPSHFWLMRLGDDYNLAMEDIMDQMTAYFKSAEGRERRLARGAVRVGQYCASLYDGDWHRSLIVGLPDGEHAQVRHVDYGTVDTVGVGSLRPLLRAWARLPAQALRARLAALRPAKGTRRWTHAACLHFLGLVKDRRLVANVVALDPAEEWFETFLVDTAGDEDVCLSQEMIAAGHADPRPDSVLAAEEAYLYPRFEALESGATPNLGEIDRYLRAGLALEYVDAYRRHVPAAPPAPASPPPSPTPSLHTQIPLLLPAETAPPAPTPAAPAAPSPPPPAATPPPAPQAPAVPPPPGWARLSAAQWQTYRTLRALDPAAAHWYVTAASQHPAPLHHVPPPLRPPQFGPPQFGPPPFGPPLFGLPSFGPAPFGPPPFHPLPFGPPPGF